LAILAQTYIHLTVEASPQQISRTLEYIQYLGAVSAQDHFQQEVELDVRLEEGSLKGWLTVVGSLYLILSNYGSLREGIDYAVKDSKEFSAWVIDQFRSEVPIEPDDLYRTERRLGLPGRIQRLYPMLEGASVLVDRRKTTAALKRLEQVQGRISAVVAELKSADEQSVLTQVENLVPESIRPWTQLPHPLDSDPDQPLKALTLAEPAYTRRTRPKELLLRIDKPPQPPDFR
jgi:hypothetical protein